jgi:hypothetical protein
MERVIIPETLAAFALSVALGAIPFLGGGRREGRAGGATFEVTDGHSL